MHTYISFHRHTHTHIYIYIYIYTYIHKFAGLSAQGVLDPGHEGKKCWLVSKEVIHQSLTVDLRGRKVPGESVSSLLRRQANNIIKPIQY